jgi:putative flippase GtrA
MLILTELFGVYFVISTAIGAFIGAILNYTVNRVWVFRAFHSSAISQIPKFILIAGTSILLNTYGTYLFTEVLMLDYRISRIVVGLIVAIAWNFLMQKVYVFKAPTSKMPS